MPNLKAGDIVFVSGSDLPGLITRFGNIWGKLFNLNSSVHYTHVGIMANNKEIIEAVSRGVALNQMNYQNIAVFRSKILTGDQINYIVNWLYSQCGTRYSWWLLFSLATLKVLHLEWLFRGIGHNGTICSVLVAKAFDREGIRFNSEGLDTSDPSDQFESCNDNKNAWERLI